MCLRANPRGPSGIQLGLKGRNLGVGSGQLLLEAGELGLAIRIMLAAYEANIRWGEHRWTPAKKKQARPRPKSTKAEARHGR